MKESVRQAKEQGEAVDPKEERFANAAAAAQKAARKAKAERRGGSHKGDSKQSQKKSKKSDSGSSKSSSKSSLPSRMRFADEAGEDKRFATSSKKGSKKGAGAEGDKSGQPKQRRGKGGKQIAKKAFKSKMKHKRR